MCESENLIMSVEKNPCIWDINHTDYHNRDIKELAWEQVCKEVFNNWETCTYKPNKRAELKKKWTNIRDYYRKELKKTQKAGNTALKSKKYVYGELLQFLAPIFTKSEGNYPIEYSDCTQPESENEDSMSIELEDVNNMEPVPTTPVVNIQKKKKDVPPQILDILQKRQNTTVMSNTDEDDDTKFLLSFRSYMRKMNTDQKIDFKIGMLKLVRKINGGPSSSRSPYDNSLITSPHSVYTSYSPKPPNSPIPGVIKLFPKTEAVNSDHDSENM